MNISITVCGVQKSKCVLHDAFTVVAEGNSPKRKPSPYNVSLTHYYIRLLYNRTSCGAVEPGGRVCLWRHCDVRRLWQRSKRTGHWHRPLALGFPFRALLSAWSPANLLSALSVHHTELLRLTLLYSTEYYYSISMIHVTWWGLWGHCISSGWVNIFLTINLWGLHLLTV